jgi:hypothetical protein
LYDEENHSAFVNYRGESPSQRPRPLELTWSATIPALIAIEQAREGKQPQLHIEIKAELGYIIQCEHWHNLAVKERRRFPVFTIKEVIRDGTGITYPTAVWETMVQEVLAFSQDDPYLMLIPLMPFLAPKKP